MMRWFGHTWDAPLNEFCEHTETPVGWKCLACGRTIGQHDRGVTMPYINEDGATSECAYHLICHIKATAGPRLTELIRRERPELFE